MRTEKVVIVFCLGAIIVFFGCGGNSGYKAEWEQLVKNTSGVELREALLDLDRRYPDVFEIKSRLGELYLAAGDIGKAEAFLTAAEALSAVAPSDADRYNNAVSLGVIDFEKKRYTAAVARAERALALRKDDPRGALFLKARSLYRLGKKEEATALYDKGWSRRTLMSRLDLNLYFDEITKEGSSLRALEILETGQEQFDFSPGQGLRASELYEKMGLIDEAVLCAGMELEYLLFLGGLDKSKVRERLEDVGRKLDDRTFNPNNAGRRTLQGLFAWFGGDWCAASRAFSSLVSGHYYLSYVKTAASLECEGATTVRLKAYVELEKYFKSLPAYYYHFWRGMKRGKGDYRFSTAKEVLEKTILLAPKTSAAAETRREIARLLELDPAHGDKLLLPAELEALGAAYADGGAVSVLEPAVGLLSLPDNFYTLQGVVFLRGLSQNVPAVTSFLQKKKTGASGRLRERLSMILGN